MPARYDIRIKTLLLTLNKGGVYLSRVDICNAAFTFEASLDAFPARFLHTAWWAADTTIWRITS